MRIVKKTLKAHHFREPEAPARASREKVPSAPPARPAAPGPAARAGGQRTLDDAEEVVVMASADRSASPRSATPPAPPGAFSSLVDDSTAAGARLTLAHALYRDLGKPGTILESPKGLGFSLRPGVGAGEVRMPHPILVPLPEGHATPHQADLAIELENGALLVLDVVTTGIAPQELKALSYDALQFRRLERAFAVLVVVRVPRGAFTQDQVESVGHGYDHFFGIDEADTRSEMKFAALRSRVAAWVSAAGGP